VPDGERCAHAGSDFSLHGACSPSNLGLGRSVVSAQFAQLGSFARRITSLSRTESLICSQLECATATACLVWFDALATGANPANCPGRCADRQHMGRDVSGDDCSRSDHGRLANGDAADNGDIRAQGCALPNASRDECAAGEWKTDSGTEVIGESDPRSNEYVAFNGDAIPNQAGVLHRHAVANVSATFDEYMVADVAVCANDRAWQDVDEGPNSGAGPNVIGFADGGWMHTDGRINAHWGEATKV